MDLMLKNTYGFGLSVNRLRAEVVSTSKRKCKPDAKNLQAKAYVGRLPLIIPARGSTKAGIIPLFMPPGANQACESAVFTIRLNGTATKVSR
jgi:hypothetical protein